MATVSTMGLVSKQASIEALSGKLLEGYTLLAESCPAGCNVPLVRAAAGGESLCVSCGGNPPAPRAAQTPQRAAAASPAPAPATQPARSPEVRPLQLGSVQFGASPEPAAAAVLTEEEEGVTGGVPEAPGVPEESGLELREVFSAEARARSDEASSRLAEKLLAGYTMLAQVSPYDGVTPLVRSRKGRRYCVSSGLWLDPPSEGDEAAQEAAAGAPKGPLGAAPPAGVRVIPLEEAPEELKALVRQQQSKQQPKQEMQPEPEPAAAEVEVEVEAAAGPEAAAAPPAPAEEAPKAAEEQQVAPIAGALGRAEATLEAKLDEAHAALAATPVGEQKKWLALCELITSTAAALQALRAL